MYTLIHAAQLRWSQKTHPMLWRCWNQGTCWYYTGKAFNSSLSYQATVWRGLDVHAYTLIQTHSLTPTHTYEQFQNNCQNHRQFQRSKHKQFSQNNSPGLITLGPNKSVRVLYCQCPLPHMHTHTHTHTHQISTEFTLTCAHQTSKEYTHTPWFRNTKYVKKLVLLPCCLHLLSLSSVGQTVAGNQNNSAWIHY